MGQSNPFSALWQWLFGHTSPEVGNEPLRVISPRVLVINFDPIVDAQGTHLSTRLGHDVETLIKNFIAEIDEVSDHLVKYQFDPANLINVPDLTPLLPTPQDPPDDPPRRLPDFKYTIEEYLAVLADDSKHHEPDRVDYEQVIRTYDLIGRVLSKQIDEVWLFGGPRFGFFESHMVGQGAIYCNSEPESYAGDCMRRFVIMGFNYERDATEMVHDIGHRMESIVAQVYGSFDTWSDAYKAVDPRLPSPPGPEKFLNPRNDYERFILYDKIAPGRAEVGLVHTPPNANKDYDWNNPNTVSSGCDDWLNFPMLKGTRQMVDCSQWAGDEDAYLRWWFKRVPHVKGSKNGILNNWWDYTMCVDEPFVGRAKARV